MIWLLPASFGVGVLIGSVGIGGILLIPALTSLAGIDIHEAMATALFSFIFTGVAGTVMFHRQGSIDWRTTIPVCLGAVLFAYVGAWVNSRVDAGALAIVLAGLILVAGVHGMATWRQLRRPAFHGKRGAQWALLGALGAVASFGSGLTGVGGPALSVPLMMLFGFPALASIGTSQVVQIVAAVSGTLGHLRYGTIDAGIAAVITSVEIAGVFVGARIVHGVRAEALRKSVAVLCVVAGIVLLGRALGRP